MKNLQSFHVGCPVLPSAQEPKILQMERPSRFSTWKLQQLFCFEGGKIVRSTAISIYCNIFAFEDDVGQSSTASRELVSRKLYS